jgi:hypothetical protein
VKRCQKILFFSPLYCALAIDALDHSGLLVKAVLTEKKACEIQEIIDTAILLRIA